LFTLAGPAACADSPDHQAQRDALVAEIERQIEQTALELGTDRLDPRVAAALRKVPRHAFVPAALSAEAYANHPLPIGSGQTISQPYIVAIMSQLLECEPGDRVYELGTGSGYQAAVLAEMGLEVYSVEIVPELAERARATLEGLGYEKVHVRAGDGWLGWPQASPFQGILITAAAERVPRSGRTGPCSSARSCRCVSCPSPGTTWIDGPEPRGDGRGNACHRGVPAPPRPVAARLPRSALRLG
jgi:protein-L-isoaspartate(D-aspartate) O-methyltransferase